MRTDNVTEALLTLWENGLAHPATTRADALLRAVPGASAPALSLGERNARLMALHARLFGRQLDLLSYCPACASLAQFSADCEVLAAQLTPPRRPAPPYRCEAHGYLIDFRLPTSADIAAAAADDGFEQGLLGRCVLACTWAGSEVALSDVPETVLDALSKHMEALDPGASVSFRLDCPQCACPWQAELDAGDAVWQKVRAAAERVFLDIDALARTYGWNEREVLRLSPLRRAAYLQMVTP